jgi:hypothetical protein
VPHRRHRNGEFKDDPTEDQLVGPIAELGCSGGSFIALNSAYETQGWCASVRLLLDGSIEIASGDPRPRQRPLGHHHRQPRGIARGIITWLAARSLAAQTDF